ncbi:hypothetical protein D4764_0170330 [Takifugu flavidus]|uniref:Uncharacterized protein n=1 Tax=Takifugu flavidus TaxID=433684 RepID=A0A5C6MFI6_9TELE|nr:hypothetical protein D4764_0170330 [Takifugu flavidus]
MVEGRGPEPDGKAEEPMRGKRQAWSETRSSTSDWKSLQRVVRTAEKIIGTSLPPIQDTAKKCC